EALGRHRFGRTNTATPDATETPATDENGPESTGTTDTPLPDVDAAAGSTAAQPDPTHTADDAPEPAASGDGMLALTAAPSISPDAGLHSTTDDQGAPLGTPAAWAALAFARQEFD